MSVRFSLRAVLSIVLSIKGASMNKLIAVFSVCMLMLVGLPAYAKNNPEEARAEVRQTTQTILKDLYKVQPAAKKAIESSAGYAVFSNFGMKIFFAGGGSGSGVAINNKTKKEVFMKMVEVQAGLGLGVKKFRLVFVFDNQKTLNDFINSGWVAGAQATAAATTGGKGAAYQGAASVSPGVWLYQLTDEGLAAEVTVKGTKYYKDDELN
jgi:lipid-binding SYLF domain-containing protein